MKTQLHHIQTTQHRGEIELLYIDESGFACRPNLQSSWSPLGTPHCADASGSRKKINVLGAFNYHRKSLRVTLHEKNVCREQFVDFLDILAKDGHPGKLTLAVMDNSSIHHHLPIEKLKQWQDEHWFFPIYLPAYSPELNLIEIIWEHAKYHWRKFVTWSKEDLYQEVASLFEQFGTTFSIHIGNT
jgi:transposase